MNLRAGCGVSLKTWGLLAISAQCIILADRVKTRCGITAPGILSPVVMPRAKNPKIRPPLGITTKSYFVFTQPA